MGKELIGKMCVVSASAAGVYDTLDHFRDDQLFWAARNDYCLILDVGIMEGNDACIWLNVVHPLGKGWIFSPYCNIIDVDV